MPVVPAVFLLASIVSSPLIGFVKIILNRERMARKIKGFGKERTVRWGTHTFYTLPIEYCAFVIPTAKVVCCTIAILYCVEAG
jgi:hypothetical protein